MDVAELDREIIFVFIAAYPKGWSWALATCATMVVQHGRCANGVHREDVWWVDMVCATMRIVNTMGP